MRDRLMRERPSYRRRNCAKYSRAKHSLSCMRSSLKEAFLEDVFIKAERHCVKDGCFMLTMLDCSTWSELSKVENEPIR